MPLYAIKKLSVYFYVYYIVIHALDKFNEKVPDDAFLYRPSCNTM